MDVVDDQDVDVPVPVAELVHLAGLDGVDELVDERVAREIEDAVVRQPLEDLLADCLEQMRLAESNAAMDEERVVGLPRELRHREGGGVGEAVRVADDELAERELRVELRGGRERRVGRRCRCAPDADLDDLHAGTRAEDLLCSARERALEALGDPRANLGGRPDHDGLALERDGLERCKPDVVGGGADRAAEHVLHGGPDVREMLGHDSGERLLEERRAWMGEEDGPLTARRVAERSRAPTAAVGRSARLRRGFRRDRANRASFCRRADA